MVDRRIRYASPESLRKLQNEVSSLRSLVESLSRGGSGFGSRGGGQFGQANTRHNRRARDCSQCHESEIVLLDQDILPAAMAPDGICILSGQAIALEWDSASSCYRDTRPAGGICRPIEVASLATCGTHYAGEIGPVLRKRKCEPYLIQSDPCRQFVGKYLGGGDWEIQTADGPRTVPASPPLSADPPDVGEERLLTLTCDCGWNVGCCGEVNETICECACDWEGQPLTITYNGVALDFFGDDVVWNPLGTINEIGEDIGCTYRLEAFAVRGATPNITNIINLPPSCDPPATAFIERVTLFVRISFVCVDGVPSFRINGIAAERWRINVNGGAFFTYSYSESFDETFPCSTLAFSATLPTTLTQTGGLGTCNPPANQSATITIS